MRLLATGSEGMLGQDLRLAARAAGHEFSGLTRDVLDITDAAAVRAALAAEKPDVVVNCAAWTDVDGAESSEAAAQAVNGDGAGNVARAAAELGLSVVHVSTDYVFDGTGERDMAEDDEPRPLGAYGRTKLDGERQVAAASGRHAIVRTSWLFGTGGRNFVATMLGLASDRTEVTVVSDQVGCPTWTGHLAPALVQIAERGLNGVMHVAGSGACSWHAFAVEIFRQAGVACTVHAGTTAELGRPAPRPARSVLRSTRPEVPVLPPWQEGLAGYLAARVAGSSEEVAA